MTAYDASEWSLPERALETLILLVVVVVVSVVGLIPGQGHVALGLELLAVALVAGWGIVRLPAVYTGAGASPRAWEITRWGVRVAALVPLLLGAATLLAETGGGLYWVAAAIVFAILGAVANAWVLLVEILR